MGVYFSWEGTVKLRHEPAVQDLFTSIEKPKGELWLELFESDDGESYELTCDGGDHCSFNTAEDLQSQLLVFSPYAIEGAEIRTYIDDELTSVLIGSPEQIEKMQSEKRVQAATEALQQLIAVEREQILRAMKDPKFWRM
jgi:hypothetical protein